MQQRLFILGRQPALGRAELESLLGASVLEQLGPHAVLTSTALPAGFFNRLGGSVKQAVVIATLQTTDWPAIERFARSKLTGLLTLPAGGKLQLGVSVYAPRVSPAQAHSLGLNIKKKLRSTDRSVRVISPQGQAYLSSAQVIGNKLTGQQGIEVVFYAHGGRTIVAVTEAEQDINSYTVRDRERPKRDAKVGMLPPKLAQILINLATGPATNGTILDPFCGTGVLLQEAQLMGFTPYGTDLEPRMIEYSEANLAWLADHYAFATTPRLEVGDATDHRWQPIDYVAAETYLGRAFTTQPTTDQLHDAMTTCNLIIKKFLRNLHGQMSSGTRLALAVPAWQSRPDQFRHLPLLDLLEEMGYNRVSFEHAGVDQLIYYRADQVVARELLVITRK